MKYEIEFVDNPKFESIAGLTNTTFDPDNYREDRMATEAQVLAAWNATADLETEAIRCCKKMCVWETYVQIVRMNTNTIASKLPDSGGVIVSPFGHNRTSGVMRRGEIYTVDFSLPFDSNLYSPYTVQSSSTGGYPRISNYDHRSAGCLTQYRIVLDATIQCPKASEDLTENQRRSGFFKYDDSLTNNEDGKIINYLGDWGSFIRSIADDGTVRITDSRMNEDFTVIRYYTQWTLRECADGSLLPDPT